MVNFLFCNRSSSIHKRKGGKRGGKLAKFSQRCYNAPLPRIILANVQSIHNKINEIVSRMDNLTDYHDCNVYCFTPTWLTSGYPDSAHQAPGFAAYRHDRNRDISGESRGGGVCFLINKNCCTDVHIISQGATSNLLPLNADFFIFHMIFCLSHKQLCIFTLVQTQLQQQRPS